MTDRRHPVLPGRYRCVQAGSTLLVNGALYTVRDLGPYGFVEMNECPGFLFGPWRFERAEGRQ